MVQENPQALKIYVNTPKEFQIDPSFYPCRQRYITEEYERIVRRNHFAINFLNIPSLEHFSEVTKEWMTKQGHVYLRKISDVLDFTSQMFCKFLTLLLIYFTCFEDVKLQNKSFYQFYFGYVKLEWDFNITRLLQQVHGLYENFCFLRSHYRATFEEIQKPHHQLTFGRSITA